MNETPRQSIITRAEMLRAEIGQHLADVARLNALAEARGETPIDPAPDGTLQRIADGLERMFAAEGSAGPTTPSTAPVVLDSLYGVVRLDPPLAYAASETARAFVGRPVLIDEAVPAGVVEMRSGGRVVSRLTCREDGR